MTDAPDTLTICGRRFDLRRMPDYRRNYLDRLARLKTAAGAAIRLKCFECSGYSAQEANKCQNIECALYVLRRNRAQRRKLGNQTTEKIHHA